MFCGFEMEIVDLGLWFREKKILIFGDFHLGYEEALNKEGLLIPRQQFNITMDRLKKIIVKTGKLDKIVVNGDLKHEFGTISDTEWSNSFDLIDFFSENCSELVLIKGNHDTILGPIAKKKNLGVVEYFIFDKTLVCHGDKIIDREVERIIIGHEHPALELKKGRRIEKYKCFLFGKFKDKELIVMPSFNLVKEGANVLSEKFLSPYLKDISKFNVKVVENFEVLNFGQIKNLIQ